MLEHRTSAAMSARPNIRARDSLGKQVSLLNDDEMYSHHVRKPQVCRSTSTSDASMTRASSNTSSNSSSPSTPGLLRATSYDSQNTNGPICPLTPVSVQDHGKQSAHPNTSPVKSARYDFFPRMETYEEYPSHHQFSAYSEARNASFAESHIYEDEDTYGSTTNGPERAGKRYPCRFRESHGCEKTFTTSGHASRHSKIHTAEKAVHCSHAGCQKKFTRADNMKQHLETHFKDKNRTSSMSSTSSTTIAVAAAIPKASGSSKLTHPAGIKKSSHPGSRAASRPELCPLDPALYNACASSAASSPATTPYGTFSDRGSFSPAVTSRPSPAATDCGLGLLALAADFQSHH